jgi:pimeloyl-ACP methyl ester carboxylesterase
MTVATVLAVVALPAAAQASSSLYHGPAPRPGPAMLYRQPATSPQLANHGIWHAKPILVSGTSAYRRREFLYQDFIYDDHGARGTARDSGDPRSGGDTFSAPNGTYTYPTAAKYANNAADLLELRVKPLRRATAFRISLNTLKDPSLVATTIAIGSSKQPQAFPFGANASAPAKLFLTVHGKKATLQSAASGKLVGAAPRVSISKRRRQIQVRVSHRDWNPGQKKVRLAAGVGLWDSAAHAYLIPGDSADAHTPGGAVGLSNPTAFFNVAFRYKEPWPDLSVDGGVDAVVNPAWWRDKAQAAALANGDLTEFHANVDFGKLASGKRDLGRGKKWGVPKSGPMDRIYASHFESEQGADYSVTCGGASECIGELRGRLQPYAIYVPKKAAPRSGYGLTLLLHSLAANYNQFANSRNQSQFGDRGQGSIVITASGRGPDSWYYGQAGADTFEMWADAARHYHLNPRWTAIAGYSMGGYATYKFATQYPDLFARAQPTVGPPGQGIWVPPSPPTGGAASNTNSMLASVRNVPFLIWDGTNDELVPVPGPVAQAQTFDDLGYRYAFDLFAPPVDHFALAANDEYAPAAKFLGTAKVDRNPPHVTYVVNPTMDFPKDGTVADHAYWLSGLKLRDGSGGNPLGEVDARSEGFGVGDATAHATSHTLGTLTGGNTGPFEYAEQSKSWGKAPTAPKRNVLHLTATNLSAITVHPKRARLGCNVHIDLQTDGPLTVHLAGCGKSKHFNARH